MTYNVPLHKLCEVRCLDLHVGLGFHPLGEIISGHQNEAKGNIPIISIPHL